MIAEDDIVYYIKDVDIDGIKQKYKLTIFFFQRKINHKIKILNKGNNILKK